MVNMQIDSEILETLITSHRSMLRMLAIIDRQGKEGISTRKLLEKLHANNLHRVILEAERKGYIKRVKVKQRGKGNHPIYNHLTPKGHRMVKATQELGAFPNT